MFFIPLCVFAQKEGSMAISGNSKISTRTVPINRVVGLEPVGSNYLFDNWENNGVIVYGNKEIKLEKINFNLRDNWSEIMISKGTAVAILIDDPYELIIDDRKFRINSYKHQPSSINEMFFENPEVAFYRRFYFKLNTIDDIWPEGSKIHSDLYLRVSDKMPKLIGLNRRKVLKAFGKDKRQQILEIAQKNNLSFRTETDLVEIFKIYTEL